MNWLVSKLAPSLARAMSPEVAHEAALVALKAGLVVRPHRRLAGGSNRVLQSSAFGFKLPNPIAIGAGFDKDARVFSEVLAAGCGFSEVGTVTPKAQQGNPRPRVFRLAQDRAIINRLGFNNNGHARALIRLQKRSGGGVVGVNIGANKDAFDRVADYVAGLNTFYDVADYFMVNISSPNTPGLRDLQAPDALDDLMGRILEARDLLVGRGKPKKPIIVKIAPDIAQDSIKAVVGRLVAHGVDGIAVSNTTLARYGVSGKSKHSSEAGGLSGRPLFHRSTVMLARVFVETGGRVPLIGIGGVDSGARALDKIEAGATLIQLYTGLVFEGFGLIAQINEDLVSACGERGVANYRELIGSKAREWAAKPIDG